MSREQQNVYTAFSVIRHNIQAFHLICVRNMYRIQNSVNRRRIPAQSSWDLRILHDPGNWEEVTEDEQINNEWINAH